MVESHHKGAAGQTRWRLHTHSLSPAISIRNPRRRRDMTFIARRTYRNILRVVNHSSSCISGANDVLVLSSAQKQSPLLPTQPPSQRAWTFHRRPAGAMTFRNSSSNADAMPQIGTTATDKANITKRGSECYQLALDALQHASRMHTLREERLLREQFEAMERQRKKKEHHHQQQQQQQQHQELRDEEMIKDRAAGMAVIRTIVRQSQMVASKPTIQVDRWTGNDSIEHRDETCSGDAKAEHHPSYKNNGRANLVDKDEEYWQKLARQHMEESALRYGYGLALVQLGNDALDLAKEDEEKLVDLSSPSSSSTTFQTYPCFFDKERCKQWLDESPIQLAMILDQNVNVSCTEEYNGDIISQLSYHRRLALHLYAAAGERGSAEGYYNHGHMLWDASEFSRAMESFFKAMEMGDADAIYFVAAQYLAYEEKEQGENEKNDNPKFSLTHVHEQHGSTVMNILQTSNYAKPNYSLAMAHPIQQHGLALLCHAAHEYSHGPALHHLALLHNERGNRHDFCNYLTKAAIMGHPDSLFLRGHCQYFGTDGFDLDVAAAMMDFLSAAESGHVDAMVSAGALLHRGVTSEDGKNIVIEQDQRRAFELYQRAGELGSIEGWRNVVSCYATGEGVPMCMDTAKYIANTLLKENKNG